MLHFIISFCFLGADSSRLLADAGRSPRILLHGGVCDSPTFCLDVAYFHICGVYGALGGQTLSDPVSMIVLKRPNGRHSLAKIKRLCVNIVAPTVLA